MTSGPDPLPTMMNADDYLAWALDRDGRYELVDGEVVAQASERVAHARTKLRAVRALEDAARRAGLGCEAFGDGMAVRVSEDSVYEPDAQLCCGPPLGDDDVVVLDPLVVVEVRSPSTGPADAGFKLAGYFSIASVRHYLLLDPKRRLVIHHRRAGEGAAIEAQILHVRDAEAPDLLLDPPGLSLPLADLFPPEELPKDLPA